MITTSSTTSATPPSADSPDWSDSVPTEVVLDTFDGYYLFAWVKNAEGLVNERYVPLHVQYSDPAPYIPAAGEVIFTEVMRNPAVVGDEQGEWFELYNTRFESIYLGDYPVSDTDVDPDTFTIEADLFIPAHGYLVFCAGAEDLSYVTSDYLYSYADMALSNTGDELVLETSASTEIDRIEYDGTWPGGAGVSMELDPTTLSSGDNDDPANWHDAIDAYGGGDLGTPGAANSSGI